MFKPKDHMEMSIWMGNLQAVMASPSLGLFLEESIDPDMDTSKRSYNNLLHFVDTMTEAIISRIQNLPQDKATTKPGIVVPPPGVRV